MSRLFVVIFSAALFFTGVHEALAVEKCVTAEGEAAIAGADMPSAKAEAVARAKFSAIEQVVGVAIKAQTIVENMAFVEDAVSKEIKGVVTKSDILDEKSRGDSYWVKVNACVETAKARAALSELALNNAIAVFVPVRRPDGSYEETNILSETLMGSLIEKGYIVTDLAPAQAIDARQMENALKSGNYASLRGLVYQYLSNVFIVGKVDYTVSSKKGEDIGYGQAMPFNAVTARLLYRIVVRDESGKMVVLAAGAAEGKGLALDVEDATANALKDLAAKTEPVLTNKLAEHIKGVAKNINIKVAGVGDINATFEVKEILQNMTWVLKVEDRGIGEFTVSYPENTIYLANSINQRPGLRVVRFSVYSIDVEIK